MASLGPGNYVVPVGGSKVSDIELVLQREPRIGKTLFLAGSILPNEKPSTLPFESCLRKLAFWRWK
jgi:hypothetical protein